MDDYTELFTFLNEKKGLSLKRDDFKQISLDVIIDEEKLNSWQKQLLYDRFFSFMKLFFLDYYKPSEVVVGSSQSFIYPGEYEEDGVTKELGPSVFEKKFSHNIIFDVILSYVDLSQIYLSEQVSLVNENILTSFTLAQKDFPNYDMGPKCYYFVHETIFLFPQSLIVSNEKKDEVLSLVLSFKEKLVEFLDEYKDALVIPHLVFAKWLHEMLPQRIRLKELE